MFQDGVIKLLLYPQPKHFPTFIYLNNIHIVFATSTTTTLYSLSINCVRSRWILGWMGGGDVYSLQNIHHKQPQPSHNTKFNVFPFSNFRYFSLFFQSSFSSFHHCTCSLSVSGFYLAFDRFYHLFLYYITNKQHFRSALPSKSTLSFHNMPNVFILNIKQQDYHLLLCAFPGQLYHIYHKHWHYQVILQFCVVYYAVLCYLHHTVLYNTLLSKTTLH